MYIFQIKTYRWGGCMVALVSGNQVDTFIEHLKENFYKDCPAAQNRNLNEIVFPTQPGAGAAIIKL